MPVLVVQGQNDRFGIPPAGPDREVVVIRSRGRVPEAVVLSLDDQHRDARGLELGQPGLALGAGPRRAGAAGRRGRARRSRRWRRPCRRQRGTRRREQRQAGEKLGPSRSCSAMAVQAASSRCAAAAERRPATRWGCSISATLTCCARVRSRPRAGRARRGPAGAVARARRARLAGRVQVRAGEAVRGVELDAGGGHSERSSSIHSASSNKQLTGGLEVAGQRPVAPCRRRAARRPRRRARARPRRRGGRAGAARGRRARARRRRRPPSAASASEVRRAEWPRSSRATRSPTAPRWSARRPWRRASGPRPRRRARCTRGSARPSRGPGRRASCGVRPVTSGSSSALTRAATSEADCAIAPRSESSASVSTPAWKLPLGSATPSRGSISAFSPATLSSIASDLVQPLERVEQRALDLRHAAEHERVVDPASTRARAAPATPSSSRSRRRPRPDRAGGAPA